MSIFNYKHKINNKKNYIRRGIWQFLFVVTSFIFMGIIYYLIYKASLFLQKLMIPDNTLYYIPTQEGSILIVLSEMFLSMPIGFYITNFLFNLIKPARDRFNRAYKNKNSYKIAQNQILKFLKYTMFITLPLIILGIFSYVYITPKGIYYNFVFGIKEKHYNWSDIKKIRVEVFHKRFRQYFCYTLIMSDNNNIELMLGNLKTFMENYKNFSPYIKSQKSIYTQYRIEYKMNIHRYVKKIEIEKIHPIFLDKTISIYQKPKR